MKKLFSLFGIDFLIFTALNMINPNHYMISFDNSGGFSPPLMAKNRSLITALATTNRSKKGRDFFLAVGFLIIRRL
ncbi:MAG: hypothetical protein AB7V00_06030 [Bacilli bacterium]